MERLPQLNYSLLKDNALKKKMLELGISSAGSRALLVNRHIEWVNLVNANCDSTKPRSKRDLLRELDVWDRNQSRQASNSTGGGAGAGIMHKDFDGLAWASSHNTDFQALIAKARQKPHSNVEVNSSPASLLPNDLASSRPVDQPGSPPNDQDPDRNASLTKMSIEEAAAVRQGSFVDLDMEN
ncbi:E3 ubiquitin-protein ligase rad18 [Puttea exsequens]|nr:E3 ubiquitin-protein ligase rad18 [Puttea exsequens]